MCECGCGETSPLGTFPAPDGGVYALEVYPGCDDCHTGPGVVVHHWSAEQWRDYREVFGDVPPLPFHERGDWRECAVPVMSHKHAAAAIRDVVGDEEYDEMTLGDDPFSYRVMRKAVLATLNEWASQTRGA